MPVAVENAAECAPFVFFLRYVFNFGGFVYLCADGFPCGRQHDIVHHFEMNARTPLVVLVDDPTELYQIGLGCELVWIFLCSGACKAFQLDPGIYQTNGAAGFTDRFQPICRCRNSAVNIIDAFFESLCRLH